ncbi:hypothetical protein FOXG_20920 [Fusarium oxysporum f. sp. lycopersici 4287]|uniref:Uncharacterized protein n=1 Tax=Fusarium oxysporum f. sp. lycopersici (strain 4287 / CBS 123668 / FGSC 9935 / NRRL 34936) TaxID=426428 RepID=A0A0J9VSF6_FUSO4|nr:hypothetical protein FOXG_20920 [Fusarium oxysporum f. sp. lycopersici 4287]KNB13783.1 hypothetical protein FOXG_20920 [Fusarium oxysporum f. sp. lycopersici 4287]
MEIERSSATDVNDPQRVKEGMTEDCENADDRDAFLQLLRYELPSFGVDGSWRDLSPWEDERCGVCVEDQCRHDIYKYEHRGSPCVQVFIKEYPTTPIFLRELLSNPKLHVTV